jgi:hypothetical protein
MPNGKPNILIIWGDDIGITNLSCYSDGLMGYRTPNIDRIANEGMRLQLLWPAGCTAGRAAFITGQNLAPACKVGMRAGHRPAGRGRHYRRLLKPLLRHRPVRQEPLRRPNKYCPLPTALTVLRQPLSPERRGAGNVDHPPEADFPNFKKVSARGASSIPGPRRRTIPPSIRAGAASASSASRTPAR